MQLTEATERQIHALSSLGFGNRTDIVRLAVDRMYREEGTVIDRDWRLDTDDRVQQVNWLRELAYNISQNLGEGTAEELVEYALSDEGRESWDIELPSWFDDHDRGKLIEWVAENLE